MTDSREWTPLDCAYCEKIPRWEVWDTAQGSIEYVCDTHKMVPFSESKGL